MKKERFESFDVVSSAIQTVRVSQPNACCKKLSKSDI